jgi:phospholipid/cholesterol/gamma-HCH transport system substrate-binding protein
MIKKRTLISIILLVGLIGGWYYIKNHTKLLSKDTLYYAYYDDVKGMQESSTVYLKGVKVGKVKAVNLHTDQKVEVVFALNERLRLPEGTAAIIGVGDLIGNKSVHLEAGRGPGYLKPNGLLVAGFDTTMIENFDAKISPVLHHGKVLLKNADSALKSFDMIINKGLGFRAQEDIEKFHRVTGNFSEATGKVNMTIHRYQPTITSLNNSLSDPEETNRGLNKTLAENEKKTQQMSKTQVRQDLEETRVSVNKLMNAMSSLGRNKLLTDTTSYLSTTRGLDTLNQSMKAFQKDPPSPIKIFSGKKK